MDCVQIAWFGVSVVVRPGLQATWGREAGSCVSAATGAAVIGAVLLNAAGACERSALWFRCEASGAEGSLGPVGCLEFVEDAGDVVLHGFQGDPEGAGDLLVACALG